MMKSAKKSQPVFSCYLCDMHVLSALRSFTVHDLLVPAKPYTKPIDASLANYGPRSVQGTWLEFIPSRSVSRP